MEDRTVIDLTNARALIEDEGRWVQGHYRLGVYDPVTNEGYVRHCSVGALEDVGACYLAYHVLRRMTHSVTIMAWNDAIWRTHASVLRGFDRAIAYAECEHLSMGYGSTWLMRRAYAKHNRERLAAEAKMAAASELQARLERITSIPRVDALSVMPLIIEQPRVASDRVPALK